MPRTSKADAPVALDEPVIEGRYVDLDGYTVGYETHKADIDPAELFRGLPDDRCQCPHWGVVTKGKMVFRYDDHDEVFEAGDAYYGAPGHLPLLFAGTEVVEFSPTGALDATMGVVGANLEAAKVAGAFPTAASGDAGASIGNGSVGTATDDAGLRDRLVREMIVFLETGAAPEGLFRSDVFCDFSLPHWRLQTQGIQDVVNLRKSGHSGPSTVTHWRADPTPRGFVFEFEERWDEGGVRWYARELIRAEIVDGSIAELSVYCTGDWDEARQSEHARTVKLIRP
jgi:hypothetical protein